MARGTEHGRRKPLAPICDPHRCRQHLAPHRRGPFRGSRQIRRGECSTDLRGFLRPALEVMGRDPARSTRSTRTSNSPTRAGKNASDIAMVIDAMDLLHSGRLDGFCLVSSDSDFTRLASRLREQGADVYGFGEQKTPRVSGRRAAGSFTPRICCPMPRSQHPRKGHAPKALQPPSAAIPILNKAIAQMETEDGWVGLGRGGATTREHRLRLRPAHLRLSKTQRSGPKDRSVRHEAAGGQRHSNPAKADTTIEGQGDQAATLSLTGASVATNRSAARSPPRPPRRRAARPPPRRAAPGCDPPPTVPGGGSAPPSPSSRAAASALRRSRRFR